MGLNQLKNLNWAANERLDLDDLTALSSLKDADLRELFNTLLEPSTNGVVFYGFDIAGATGAYGSYQPFAAVDGLAVAGDGSFLELLAASAPTVALTNNAMNYIHAYLLPQTSDTDNRRFINDALTPPTEYTLATPTRMTKTTLLYVTTTAETTPTLTSFSTSAVLGGASRALVATAAVRVTAGSIVSATDFRQTWMVEGNAGRTGAPVELPFTVGGSPGPRNVFGIRSMFRALASAIKAIVGGATWWATPPASLTYVAANMALNNGQNNAGTAGNAGLQGQGGIGAPGVVGIGGTNGAGVTGTGTGSGAGVLGTAGASGSAGVAGTNTNGAGVTGSSTNGAGVTGSSTNGAGLNGSSTNGAGVAGQGGGSASGGTFTGGATGQGVTGQGGTGQAGGSFTGGAGGVGVAGAAGSGDNYGGQFTGHGAGAGVAGVGGTTAGTPGGWFAGAGAGCPGVLGRAGSPATNVSPQYAARLEQGYMQFADAIVSPDPTTPIKNTVTPSSIIKCWGEVNTGPAPALNAGFNVTGTPSYSSGSLLITMPYAMLDSPYYPIFLTIGVTPSGGRSWTWQAAPASSTSFTISAYNAGTLVDLSAGPAAGCFISFMVLGRQ
jgi:hypothetical protein